MVGLFTLTPVAVGLVFVEAVNKSPFIGLLWLIVYVLGFSIAGMKIVNKAIRERRRKPEPPHMCKLIDKIQADVSEIYQRHENEYSFREGNEDWDNTMAILYNLDVLRMQIERLRKWAKD